MKIDQEEIAYRTLYLLQNNWKRIYPYEDIFEKELKRLEISLFSSIKFDKPFWIKQTSEREWQFYTHSICVEQLIISSIYKDSIFFSLDDAFNFEMELNK